MRRKTLKKGVPKFKKLITLAEPLLGEKYVAQKRRKERKKNNPKNSGHIVPQQRLRAAHALRSDQFPVCDM